MKPCEVVAKTIKGEKSLYTPLYAWIWENVNDKIERAYGSMAAFEDKYEFDMAHIFGAPPTAEGEGISKWDEMRQKGIEVTPEVLLEVDPWDPPNDMAMYAYIIQELKHHKERDRFCYMQTPGIFECLNGPFGIENHLCYLALYPDELKEVYRRQAEWNRQYALNICELGMDMIHVSDDWGSQQSLLFNPKQWWELIYPNHLVMTQAVKKAGKFVSLHSDGNVNQVLDGIVALGYDLVHPYQESAGMSYDTYLEKYSDKFAILGGICIQTTLGFGNYERLESEIQRVFGLLKGKRWCCCTSHLVQPHCSLEELEFALNLAHRLCGK